MSHGRRDSLHAILLAALIALLFLWKTVLPTQVLAPFPPEVLEPLRSAALARGDIGAEDLLAGNPQMGDKFILSLAWDRVLQSGLHELRIPRWSRDFGGGSPVVPLMGQVYEPWNLLLFCCPSAGVYGTWCFLHLVLFAFFGYRFLRRLQCSHLAALIGMVTLELGFWTQARVHHNVILTAALPAFAILSCVHELVVRRGGLWHVALLALGTGLTWLSGFAIVSLQITYLAAAYALYLALRQPSVRLLPLGAAALGLALGALLAAAQILPVLFAAAVTSRQPIDLALMSRLGLEWDHLSTLVWPTLFEWPAAEFYGTPEAVRPSWAALALLERQFEPGFNFPETAFYVGVLPLAFTAAGLKRARGDRDVLFFAVVAALSLCAALAVPGVLHAITLLPGTTAGDIKRVLFLFHLAVPVLVAKGFDGLGHLSWRSLPVILLAGVAITSFLAALLHLASPAALQEFYGSLAEANLNLPDGTMEKWVADYPSEGMVNRHHLLGCFLHAGVVASLAAASLLWLRQRAALLVLIVVDLLIAGWGTRVAVPLARVTTPPAILTPVLDATAQAEQRHLPRPRLQRWMPPKDARWMQVPVFPNLGAYFGVEDASVYCTLPKARMEEFFTAIEPRAKGRIDVAPGGAGVFTFRDRRSLQHPLLDLFGIEWILAPGPLGVAGLTDATPAGLPDSYRLFHREGVLPRATFVTAVQVIPDKTARLRRLSDSSRVVATQMILEDPAAPMPTGPPGSPPGVEVVRHADEKVVVRVQNDVPGYLRLADPYDAGWTARVDGEPQPIWVADHYLRAVWLPAGDHEVLFAFDGPRVLWPVRLSLLGLSIWLLVAAVGFHYHRCRTTVTLPAA